MHWIKHLSGVATLLLVGACGGKAPVIPQEGEPMTAIYRQALGRSSPQKTAPVFADEAQALCQQLPVKVKLAECINKAQRILLTQRLAVPTDPTPQRLDYVPYTRDAANEVEQLFPRMPNPDLVIYIYPHLATRTRAPIPGYTSVIPLFARVEYQLPGERPPQD